VDVIERAMEINEIAAFIRDIGIPGALLIYLVWRLDKFLTFLCAKLNTYNDEFGKIFAAGMTIGEELKQIKQKMK